MYPLYLEKFKKVAFRHYSEYETSLPLACGALERCSADA